MLDLSYSVAKYAFLYSRTTYPASSKAARLSVDGVLSRYGKPFMSGIGLDYTRSCKSGLRIWGLLSLAVSLDINPWVTLIVAAHPSSEGKIKQATS